MQALQGWLELGDQTATISGIASTNVIQASYPGATVTVNVHGGGLATIYSDNNLTPLANPFSPQTNGYWEFYAANGRYDVIFSGGGIASPFTLSDLIAFDGPGIPTSISFGQITVTFSSTPAFNATSGNQFQITLTGNVSSSTFTGGVAGCPYVFEIIQDGTGGRTFVWPANVLNAEVISPVASSRTVQAFFFDGTNLRPVGPATVN